MSDELAREHVETLLAAAQELADACIMIAKQLRPPPAALYGPDSYPVTDRSPASRAADLLDQTADSTGETRHLLRAVLRALDAQPEGAGTGETPAVPGGILPGPLSGGPVHNGTPAFPPPPPVQQQPVQQQPVQQQPAYQPQPYQPPVQLPPTQPVQPPVPAMYDLGTAPSDGGRRARRDLDEPSFAAAFGGSTPSTGGSVSAAGSRRGRHAVDETGAWRVTDVYGGGGRHSREDNDGTGHGGSGGGSGDGDDPGPAARLGHTAQSVVDAADELLGNAPIPSPRTVYGVDLTNVNGDRGVQPAQQQRPYGMLNASVQSGYDPAYQPQVPAPGYGSGQVPAAFTPPAFAPEDHRPVVADPAQLSISVRQVEASRRHLQAALLTLRDALGSGGDVSLIALVERSLSAVSAAADQLRDTLDPADAERALPGEARFCCSQPWEKLALVPAAIALAPATVPGAARILAALGYDARTAATVDGQPQISVGGDRYRVRVVLQQLRLAGGGEWQAYLDWLDEHGQQHTEVENLGPAELTDDEVAHRTDDALRRRLSD